MNVLGYLKQPFPKAESKWKIIVLISLFVALFLIVFQPFDINLLKSNFKILILVGYGLVTFVSLVFNLIFIETFFSKFFDERNWFIWKEFVWLLWIIFSIGLGNALYTFSIFDTFGFSFHALLSFQLITFIVSLFPITILIITKQNYLLKRHAISATDLNKSIKQGRLSENEKQNIHFFADNEKDFIEFEINNFLFIESSGNYIEIHYLKDDKLIRKTFRSTLKRALEFFKQTPQIIQCHRAFIINSAKITNAKGNSQGLILHLENCDYEVPVSRNYVDVIRNQIK